MSDLSDSSVEQKSLNLNHLVWLLPFSLLFQLINLLATNAQWPGTGFLFRPDDRLNDLLNPIRSISLVNPYAGERIFFSPPGMASLLKVISAPGQWFGVLTLVAAYIGLSYKFSRSLTTSNANSVAILLLLGISYPVLFALDRGSYTLWITLLLVLTVSNNQAHPLRAACYFGVALSLGFAIAPLALLLLFRYESNFVTWIKQGMALLATAIIITSIGLLDLRMSPISMWNNIQRNLSTYNQVMLHTEWGAMYSHSLFNGLRSSCALIDTGQNFSEYINPLIQIRHCSESLQPLVLLSWIALVASLMIVFFSRSDFFYRSLLLVSAFLFFTPISADYRLCFLLLPLISFRASLAAMRTPKFCVFVIAFTFLPRTLNVLWMTRFSETTVLFSNISGSLAILTLVAISFIENLKSLTIKPWVSIKALVVSISTESRLPDQTRSYFYVCFLLPCLNFAVLIAPMKDPVLSIIRLSYFLILAIAIIFVVSKKNLSLWNRNAPQQT
jgi:hypothetical protein